jgi:glutamate-1-semialdehyde 2,1-aminomutase
VPSVQKVRMTNSGTEACMSAIRLARGFHAARQNHQVRRLLSRPCGFAAGQGRFSGALTFGHPDSAGVPAAFTQHTIVLPFNDVEAVKAAFAANKNEIAGIIVEPVPGNAGLVSAEAGLSGISARNHRRPTARC